jgi:hypothetical protein
VTAATPGQPPHPYCLEHDQPLEWCKHGAATPGQPGTCAYCEDCEDHPDPDNPGTCTCASPGCGRGWCPQRDDLAATPGQAPDFDRAFDAEERYLEAERTIDDYREEVSRLAADRDRERVTRLHLAGERDVAMITLRQLFDFAWTLSDKLGHREQLNRIMKRSVPAEQTDVKPEPQPAPSHTEWVVFWGGESPDDCAGWDSRGDEADAEEHREWIAGGGVACRPVMYGPWTVTVPPPPDGRGLSGDWSDEELAEFRRWREHKQETGQ